MWLAVRVSKYWKKLFSYDKKLQDLSHDIVPLSATTTLHPFQSSPSPSNYTPYRTDLILCVELVIQRRLHAKDANRWRCRDGGDLLRDGEADAGDDLDPEAGDGFLALDDADLAGADDPPSDRRHHLENKIYFPAFLFVSSINQSA